MKVKLMAITPVSFTNDRGETITGAKLHYQVPLSKEEVERGAVGSATCDNVFLKNRKVAEFVPNKDYNFVYDVVPGSRKPTLISIDEVK